MAHIAQEKFGFDPRPVAELIHWADIIDGAKFESPQQAVELAEPAMKLTMAIESTNDNDFLPTLIPYLVREPLAKVIQEPFVAALIPPLLDRHRRSIEILRGGLSASRAPSISISQIMILRDTTNLSRTTCIRILFTASV